MGEAPSRAGRARQSKAVGRRYRGGTSGAGPVRERTPKPSASLWARFRYRLDNALSRGAWVVIGYLGLVTLAIVLLAAVITVIAHLIGFGGGGQRLGVLESFWQMLVRVVDAGSFASDATWPTRLLALLVTLAGRDKTSMEEILRAAVGDLRTTRLVGRRGDPSSMTDLRLVGAPRARSILVMSGEEGDAGAIKSSLAVLGLGLTGIPIIVEMESASQADTLEAVTGSAVVTVTSDRVIAEVTAQACHERGLSTVFQELLDFDGDELYFREFPELHGATYAQAQQAFAGPRSWGSPRGRASSGTPRRTARWSRVTASSHWWRTTPSSCAPGSRPCPRSCPATSRTQSSRSTSCSWDGARWPRGSSASSTSSFRWAHDSPSSSTPAWSTPRRWSTSWRGRTSAS